MRVFFAEIVKYDDGFKADISINRNHKAEVKGKSLKMIRKRLEQSIAGIYTKEYGIEYYLINC